MLLDGLGAEGPIPIAAREHHADGKLPLVSRQRAQKHIHRFPLAFRRTKGSGHQPAPGNGEDEIRRHHIDPVRLHGGAICGDEHGHPGETLDHFMQMAAAIRTQVGDDDKCGAGRVGHRHEEPFQRGNSSR